MRPLYQNAVSAGQPERATLLLRYWLMSLALACGLVVSSSACGATSWPRSCSVPASAPAPT